MPAKSESLAKKDQFTSNFRPCCELRVYPACLQA